MATETYNWCAIEPRSRVALATMDGDGGGRDVDRARRVVD